MAPFFLPWELWQEMTFALGCGIVIVCAMGLAKLWWRNRSLQKLEVMDEEKRARLLEMRYCGMNANRIDEIPFGIRAIQRGVEVEGIWIVKPDMPDQSSSRLVPAHGDDTFEENTRAATDADELSRPAWPSGTSTSDGARSTDPLLSPKRALPDASKLRSPRTRPKSPKYSSSIWASPHETMTTSVPTGSPLLKPVQDFHASDSQQPGLGSSAREPSGRVVVGLAAQHALQRPNTTSKPHGVPNIFTYRALSALNKSASELPAALSQPGSPFHKDGRRSLKIETGAEGPCSSRRPNTLRKKPPR